MQDAKEEVRSRLNIEDVIGEYVELKRAGRNFKGLSPFTGEKTASFYVSPEKNIWHDFSSNKGGDVFSFIMEVEGLDFRGSLELLARKAGVDLSKYESSNDKERARLKKKLLQLHDLAANYYQQSLVKNERAIEYVFKKRGLSKKIVTDFRIGYAPDSGDALVSFLKRKGFSGSELSQGGLTNRFGGDLFRGRMMVPLMDSTGQVIGFTGRIIESSDHLVNNGAPKYLNTPQTVLYDKGRHVFGLSQAKEAIRRNDYAVIVEGNLDVVSSHQAEIYQVVATAGTALTESHLKALSRLTENIRLAFDGDQAGLSATERAIPIAQSVGVQLHIISLPTGVKDPDELLQKDPKLWQSAIDSSEPVIDWALKQYSLREDVTSAAGKRRFTTAALAIIKSLSDPIEREHYLEKTALYVGSSKEALVEKFQESKIAQNKILKQVNGQLSEKIPESSVYQDSLLALMLVYPSLRELLDEVTSDMFTTDERRRIFEYVTSKKQSSATTEVPKSLQTDETYVKILLLKAETRYAQWEDQDSYLEAARLIRQLITEHKKKQKAALTTKLRNAEEEGDDEAAAHFRQLLHEIIKEIANAKK